MRRAYAMRLRERRPDDDAQRFRDLRAEFESAIDYLRSHADIDCTRAFAPAGAARLAIDEIHARIALGDLLGACERYDRARSIGEIGLDDEPAIESALARALLADPALRLDTLETIVRRYRWDDVLSAFGLGTQIAERLQYERSRAEPIVRSRPGTRYIGQWNWGAFCLTPFWLIRHGNARGGVALLVAGAIATLLPYGGLILLGIAIQYGRVGNAIAVRDRRFASEREFVAVQNAWRDRGFAVLGLVLVAIVTISVFGPRSFGRL